MIDSNFIKNTAFNISNVSRETIKELDDYGKSIILKNKDINLISSSTEKSINTRHILDSAQSIDFIDNIKLRTCTDLGSGAGLPGPRTAEPADWAMAIQFSHRQYVAISLRDDRAQNSPAASFYPEYGR